MRSARRHSETLSKNFQGPQYGLSSLGPLCPLFVLMIRELYIYKSSSFFIFRNLAWIRDSMTEKISYRRSYRTLARRRRMRCWRFNTDLIRLFSNVPAQNVSFFRRTERKLEFFVLSIILQLRNWVGQNRAQEAWVHSKIQNKQTTHTRLRRHHRHHRWYLYIFTAHP